MIDRVALRSAAVAALKTANTSAGQNVFSPLDWPTTAPQYPLIVVRTPHERKENSAPRMGVPQFFSTISLVVTGRVQATTEAAAETALEALSDQIETALLTSAEFIVANEIQQFVSVETTMEVRADSEQHLGETAVTFEIEVPQVYEMTIDAAGAEVGQTIQDIKTTIPNPQPAPAVQPLASFDTPAT